jgi:hypothetical protein
MKRRSRWLVGGGPRLSDKQQVEITRQNEYEDQVRTFLVARDGPISVDELQIAVTGVRQLTYEETVRLNSLSWVMSRMVQLGQVQAINGTYAIGERFDDDV